MQEQSIHTLNLSNTRLSVIDQVAIENAAIAASGIISVTNTANGRLKVFGVGTDNVMLYNEQTSHTGSSWTGWSSPGLQVTSKPAVHINSDGRLEIFARGTDNALWHNWQIAPNSGLSGWQSLGGMITRGC
ncbi:hypothetical protein [Photorhabdus africana]|uniref:hypothetical protein n=1 Tax=Photorhabdus africana TaxID=3097554 RepID=UPI002B4184FC|nr:hypothetical protein [Photorhabdus sp. CRI-LC]